MGYFHEIKHIYDRDEWARDMGLCRIFTTEEWLQRLSENDQSPADVAMLLSERDMFKDEVNQLKDALDTRQRVYEKLLKDYMAIKLELQNG